MAINEFSTPGSAVADTVQQILQRRRDAERQTMLDRLQGEQIKDSMQTSEMQRKQTADQMQTAAIQRKQLEEALLQQQLGSLQDETDIGQLSPELAAAARTRGYVQSVTPKVGSSYGVEGDTVTDPTVASGPAQELFVSPKRRAEMEQEQKFNDYIVAHPELVKENPELLNVLAMNAMGIGAPMPTSLLEPKPSVQTISPSGAAGKVIQGQRGQEFMGLNWSPAAYQPSLIPLGIDQTTGEGVFYTNRIGADNKPLIMRVPNLGGVDKFSVAGKAETLIPQSSWTAYTNSFKRGANETNTSWMHRKQQARQMLGATLNRQATTPKVVDTVNQAIQEINRSENAGQVVPNINIILQNAQRVYPDLTEAEKSTISQIMSGILTTGDQ